MFAKDILGISGWGSRYRYQFLTLSAANVFFLLGAAQLLFFVDGVYP